MRYAKPIEGHQPHYSRFCTGRSPIGRGSPFYGCRVRCECGWTDYSNEAPSKGGERECREAWSNHIRSMQNPEDLSDAL